MISTLLLTFLFLFFALGLGLILFICYAIQAFFDLFRPTPYRVYQQRQHPFVWFVRVVGSFILFLVYRCVFIISRAIHDSKRS
jgi:hypothetical protein